MRAARYDIVAETGAAFVRAFSPYMPGALAIARSVVAGDRVYYRGDPLFVYEATLFEHPTDPGLSTVSFVFGSGSWFEPRATIPADSMLYPAVPAVVLAAEAGFTVKDDSDPDLGVIEVRYPLPVSIVDGHTVKLAMDDDFTRQLVAYEGAWSWDLFVESDLWSWTRLVEGTLSIVKGSGRAD